jgi:hypothetical protein
MLTTSAEFNPKALNHNSFLSSPKVRRLLFVHERYRAIGTLAGVGREIGLTRERVRQLIQKGVVLGLFEYKRLVKTVHLINIPKEKIIEDYRNLLEFKLVAEKNRITLYQFYHLLSVYQLSREEIEKIRLQGYQLKTILHYFSFVRKKGGHLSTTELQKTGEGRYLSVKINKLWGSIHVFRKELKIASPTKKLRPIKNLIVP